MSQSHSILIGGIIVADRQSRKFLLTIQNPEEKGFTHDVLRDTCAALNADYCCMADEIAPATGTKHSHLFIFRKSAIRESTIRRKFPGIHFDACIGSCAENRAYVEKSGKWANDPKGDTSIPDTFEEWGELPSERQESNPLMADIITDLEAGKSTAEIIRSYPKFIFKSNEIDVARQTLDSERFLTEQRNVEVTYIFGATGVGKTRSIYDTYHADDICRITNYGKVSGVRFDGYQGQDVLVFDEFASQIPLAEMLCYLDRYPVNLPARYHDRVACYTMVYIISNFPLSFQYQDAQLNHPAAWKAFLRRIGKIVEMFDGGITIEHKREEYQ